MPSGRQYRVIGLVVILAILVLYYVANGERLTHESEFYRKTVAALEHKKDAEARQHIIEEERQRLERIEKIQNEHNVAVAATATKAASTATEAAAAPVGPVPDTQKPLGDDAQGSIEGEKSVAGRKKMMDGKIVNEKPATDNDDGVAKVGNVAKTTSVAKAGDDEAKTQINHNVEVELNDILKRGPIIIFSKSYCPFSKKAKHILLDLHSITPAPYVVELDRHELGPGLQDELQKSTGRRTVPNVLINGKSIGGGDDIETLHETGKLIDTVRSMGGKRIMSIKANDQPPPAAEPKQRAEVKFKA